MLIGPKQRKALVMSKKVLDKEVGAVKATEADKVIEVLGEEVEEAGKIHVEERIIKGMRQLRNSARLNHQEEVNNEKTEQTFQISITSF